MPADSENTSVLTPRPPRPGKRYFTVGDANRALPYINRIIADIRGPYSRLMDISHKLENAEPTDDREGLEADFERERQQLNVLIAELQDVGVELKDFDKLLLDFPAVHEGREISLCWHQGEAGVQSWHEIGAGFAGRQDISLLNKSEK